MTVKLLVTRYMKFFSPLIILCLGVVLSLPVSAASLRFVVTDSSGNPLKNAVIEVTATQSPTLNTANTLVMDQINKTFVPKVLIVSKGSQVSFPNSDDIRHHVYSFSKPKVFELKLYSGKPEAPIKFDQHGVVVLGCNIHDSMVGYLYVTDSPYTGLSNKSGEVVLNGLPDSIKSVTVWHPNQEGGTDERIPVEIKADRVKNVIPVRISTVDPEPRNTFQDLYRDAD
jgi:plastocyanin